MKMQPTRVGPGRGNVIVEYPGTLPGKIVSFVGCHMDVVTANPDEWDFDPFSLTIDGDKLCGRGTTDCLGHVALVTELMRSLGETKPKLKSSVVAVFIANEENSSVVGIGVDGLVKDGLLDKLKHGPLYWIDTADKQPCIGTGGVISWQLRATGKLFFHSGVDPTRLPQILYEDEDHDKVMLASDGDLAAAVGHAKQVGWKKDEFIDMFYQELLNTHH